MFITSTINPLTKSNNDIPVVLLCHEETRKFILRPKDYADLVQIVQDNFDLGPDTAPVFETSTLDICRGKSVEIDESAYPLMSEFLDEITVVCKERVGGRESPQFGRERTPQTLQTPAVTPPAQRKVATREEEAKEPHRDEMKFDTRPKQAVVLGSAEKKKQRSWQDRSDSEEVQIKAEAPLIQKSVSLTEERSSKTPRMASDPPRRKVEIPAEEEEEEGEQRLDMGGTWGGIEEPAEVPVEQHKISHRAATERLRQSLANSREEIPSVPMRSVNFAKNNERFNVTIFGPRTSQEAAFKTRGQHTVKKVLAGACKTFGVRFEGASLAVLTSFYDEDGEVVQSMAKCDGEATIAESGIDEYTQLMIVLPHGAGQDSGSDEE
ncbi:hypothetical protein BDZ94DRAFT_1296715 [Collybia nuda]|uniref:Uncharacterized protein n=1 Tax=Collybia nuda TaxID=64659 RepID=A0A9P6CKD0_9AGAR|nr:hypothetical protein BDZ94DRAFT_1296715 [Collybia nuda]